MGSIHLEGRRESSLILSKFFALIAFPSFIGCGLLNSYFISLNLTFLACKMGIIFTF